MKKNNINIECTSLDNILVLYEDNHLIAVYKRSSDIVQEDKSGDTSLEDIVKQYVKVKYQKPGNVFLGVIHRIDRPVSGIVLFAKTSKALIRMNAAFQSKEVKKTYWAVVKQLPPQNKGVLINYLTRDTQKNITKVFDKEVKDSKKAILEYELIAQIDEYYLLEIKLITGRHHQIRAQLGHIGCPIIGDNKYGYARSNRDKSIHLLSRTMEFCHPVTKENIKIIAEIPHDVIWKKFNDVK